MKKMLLAFLGLTLSPCLFGAPAVKMITQKTSSTTTVITIVKNGRTVTTSSKTTVTKVPVVKPPPSDPIKVERLSTPIDFSNWKPQAIAYCYMMFGPDWMYNPAVGFMVSAMRL